MKEKRTQSAGVREIRQTTTGSRKLSAKYVYDEVELYKTLVLNKERVVSAATYRGVIQEPQPILKEQGRDKSKKKVALNSHKVFEIVAPQIN